MIWPGTASRPDSCSASISSANAPVVSTPVGPPPTTTTSIEPGSRDTGSSTAASRSPCRCSRSRSASATEYSGKACSAAPGTPKKFGWAPAAITRCDPCNVLPSASVRLRAERSAAVTCAVTTSTEAYSLKMVRWGRAMSSAGSWELATW